MTAGSPPGVVRRVVSLVPSATETLLALGVEPVACTRFCDQPGIPTVGGTKDPDLAAIVGLAPDLVLVNDEENRREDADALLAAGLRLHAMSPRSVAAVGPAVDALADVVGVERPPPIRVPHRAAPRGRVLTFVWRRPWIALGVDTYGASVLEHLGFAGALGAQRGRYPELSLDELGALAPDLVLLPDEPYPFADRHRDEVAAVGGSATIERVDGRDLFWWGWRTPTALGRLARVLARTV